jgi:hypothetical protein
MNILWLNAGLLLPLDKGGKLRTWHLMRHLARRHDVSYLSFIDPSQTPADLEGMREVASHLVTIPRTDSPKGSLRFYADAAGYLLDRVPYAVAKYRSADYRAAIDRLLRERRFDAVVCDFLPPVVNLPDSLPCPAILFTHNVEAEIWRRHAENATNPIARFLLPAVGPDARIRTRRLPASISSWLFQTWTARRSPDSIPMPEDTGARGSDGSRYELFRTGDRASAQPTTSRVHRFDGLAAQRGRDAVLRA